MPVVSILSHFCKKIILSAILLLCIYIEEKSPLPVVMPKPALCTDNGAMIASAGYFKFKELPLTKWDLDILPGLRIGEQGF